MSPDTATGPRRIGYDNSAAWRGWVISLVVGTGAVGVIAYGTATRRTALARALETLPIPPAVLVFAVGETIVLLILLYTAVRLLVNRNGLLLTSEGIQVRDNLGQYTLGWDNLAGAEQYRAGMVGIRVKDREALLQTHQGTTRQRELLATRPPQGEYELVFLGPELDCGLETFVGWVETYRQLPERREELRA